jgi:hypothetical protein
MLCIWIISYVVDRVYVLKQVLIIDHADVMTMQVSILCSNYCKKLTLPMIWTTVACFSLLLKLVRVGLMCIQLLNTWTAYHLRSPEQMLCALDHGIFYLPFLHRSWFFIFYFIYVLLLSFLLIWHMAKLLSLTNKVKPFVFVFLFWKQNNYLIVKTRKLKGKGVS